MVDAILSKSQMLMLSMNKKLDEQKFKSTERISSGNKVNRITDNAKSYIDAARMTQSIMRQQEIIERTTMQLKVVDTAAKALEQGIELIYRADEYIRDFNEFSDNNEVASLTKNYNAMIKSIEDIFEDAEVDGKNMLNRNGDKFIVDFSDKSDSKGSEVTIETIDLTDLAAKGLNKVETFSNREAVETSMDQLKEMRLAFEVKLEEVSIFHAVVKSRNEFLESVQATYEMGRDEVLSPTDFTAESLQLQVMNVRQLLTFESLKSGIENSDGPMNLLR